MSLEINQQRDPYVSNLIQYFDMQYGRHANIDDRFAKMSKNDFSLIAEEVVRIQKDFRYAASNYFVISTKDSRDVLMRLLDSQELVVQKLEDIKRRGKPQKICVIKARQLGMSQLGCAIVSWATMFTPNRNGLIVSEDEEQSTNLFNSYLSTIYKRLPWWLKPAYSSFTLDDGIILDHPAKKGGVGLNSKIHVQWSNRKGGLGRGFRINAFHGSEFTLWNNFDDLLNKSLKYALPESPDTIGILESTANGAGTATHRFYKKCVDKAEKAEWEAVFLPYFFEKARVMAPPQGWRPKEEGDRMREVVKASWVQCSNKKCERFFNRVVGDTDRNGTTCPTCSIGKLDSYTLRDEQIFYIINEADNAEDPEGAKQELCMTAEEAFISKGESVFSADSIKWVEYCTNTKASQNPMKGWLDRHGNFHGFSEWDVKRKCYMDGCTQTHVTEEQCLWVWERPQDGCRYQIGVDVGYGKNKDYSVAIVNKFGRGLDVQVATLRSNFIDPITFALELSKLGMWYNQAEIAVEYNAPGNSTADHLLNTLGYGNCYRRKGHDISSVSRHQFHWQTLANTKPKIIVTFDRWLKDNIYIINDSRILDEIKVFKRHDELKTGMGAASGFHDDAIMAAMICLYTSHQGDFEDNYGILPVNISKTPEECAYSMACMRCLEKWGADDPSMIGNCPSCGSMKIRGTRNMIIGVNTHQSMRNELYRKPEDSIFDDYAQEGKEFDYQLL